MLVTSYMGGVMKFMTPPMYDATNIDIWKFKMSMYFKILGKHVYLATTKKIYFDNDKYIEANAQAMEVLRYTLLEEQFSILSHCDSAFAVWNTLTSLELQTINYVEKEPMVDASDEACYMV